jgi:hypothetical protein
MYYNEARRTITEMYRRRLVGIVERAVLGAAMTIVLVVVERRLSRPRGRRGARRAPGRPARDGGRRGT